MHELAAAAPEYFPAPQSVQTVAEAPLNFPAGHGFAIWDEVPAGHAYPARQGPVHCAVVSPSPRPYRPFAQGPLHAADGSPVVDPNVPAGHNVHMDVPPRPNFPKGHAAGVTEPDTHSLPTGQLASQVLLEYGADTALP